MPKTQKNGGQQPKITCSYEGRKKKVIQAKLWNKKCLLQLKITISLNTVIFGLDCGKL